MVGGLVHVDIAGENAPLPRGDIAAASERFAWNARPRHDAGHYWVTVPSLGVSRLCWRYGP